MKQLLCLACAMLLFTTKAYPQSSQYQRLYQRAHALATINYDSSLYYARQALKLAHEPRQKYGAFYLIGYAAATACSYRVAIKSYQEAQKQALDSATYFKVNKSIANAFYKMGAYTQAKKATQKNIDFLQRHQNFKGLGYAYNLRGRILLEEKKESALPALRRALGLRLRHDPKRIPDSYESLAQAFFRFGVYDSAAYYQHQIIIGAPATTSPDNQAYHYATLAKYLCFDRRPAKARPWLQQAQGIRCRLLEPGLFVAQAQALWQLTNLGPQVARPGFRRLDSLMGAALQHKTHLIDKRALNKKFIRIYRDILQAPTLPPALRDKYAAKLEAAQAWYANYSQRLAVQDQRRVQALTSSLASVRAHPWYSSQWPLYVGVAALLLGLGWLGWQQRLLPEQRQIQAEKALINTLRKKLNRQLRPDETQLVTLMYRGQSFAELATHFGTNRDQVKYQARKLAVEAQLGSLFKFVSHFKAQRQKKLIGQRWVKPRKIPNP